MFRDMIRKVYGDSINDTQIKEWFRWFKDGRVSVTNSNPRQAFKFENSGKRETCVSHNQQKPSFARRGPCDFPSLKEKLLFL